MVLFLSVLSAEEAVFSLSICQIFALSERWFSSRLLLLRFPLGGCICFFLSNTMCQAKRFLQLFDYFIDKRKSDRYMNFSGKEDHFCSESSMVGAVEGS